MLNVYGVDFKAGVNTQTYKYYIDFAARTGLEYILMDEGWSASTMDIMNPKPGLDLHELIRYGNEKGVGIVLWTLWTPMMKDMEKILDTYRDWGIKGIKIDFMQRTDQPMVNFYEDVARECFERHLIVDFHGSFKPAGLHTVALRGSAAPSLEADASFWTKVRGALRTIGHILDPRTGNRLEVWRDGAILAPVPILVLVLACALVFHILLPLLLIGLLLGCRYRCAGPDLDRRAVNDVLESISDAVESLKRGGAKNRRGGKS